MIKTCKILCGVPHGILRVFDTILYENEFQNRAILTTHLSTEQSTLVVARILCDNKIKIITLRMRIKILKTATIMVLKNVCTVVLPLKANH
jgi:hypothetical protein